MSFDPNDSAAQIAFERSQGVPYLPSVNPAKWQWFDFISSSVKPEYPTIPSRSKRPRKQTRKGKPGKIVVTGDFNVELNSVMHAIFLANLQGKGRTPTVVDVPDSVLETVLAPVETNLDFPGMSLIIDADDGEPTLISDAWVSAFNIAIANGALVTSTVSLMGTRNSYWADRSVVTEDSVPANPPQLRGIPLYADWVNVAGNDVRPSVRFISPADSAPSAGFDIKFVTRKGAAAFGPTEYDYKLGTWIEIRDETGVRFGDRKGGQKVEMFLGDAPGLAAGQVAEYQWEPKRAKLVPALPAIEVFNEIMVTATVDGASECLEQLNLSHVRPVKTFHCIGQRYALRHLPRGKRVLTGNMQREKIDNAFLKRLATAESFALEVGLYTGVSIGNSAFEDSLVLDYPNCQFTSGGADIPEGDDFPETMEFQAYENENGPPDDDLTATLTGTLDLSTLI